MTSTSAIPSCPKCGSNAQVASKLLLIGKESPGSQIFHFEELAGYQRSDQVAADECKPEVLKDEPLQQFIDGYFCQGCGLGFIPNEFLRTAK